MKPDLDTLKKEAEERLTQTAADLQRQLNKLRHNLETTKPKKQIQPDQDS